MEELIKKTATRLESRLEKEDIPFTRKDAISTNSIYFRLHGLGAIRISDHRSKADTHFNLLANTFNFYHSSGKFYYPIYNVDDCVVQILNKREAMLWREKEEDDQKLL